MRTRESRIRKIAEALRADRYLLALGIVVVAVHALFIVSFPFYIEGDGYTYFDLLGDVHSHLLHATGYVFLFSPVGLLFSLFDADLADFLMFAQHLLSALTAIVLYLALRRITLRPVAFGVSLLVGVDTQLVAAAGTTRPEFLQADLLALMVSAGIFALTAADPSGKRSWYRAVGALLMAGYLTKYNFVAAFVFLMIPVFDRQLAWRRRAVMVGWCTGAAAVFLAVFVAAFHYPTTRSLRLNLEHGWIHLLKLGAAGIPLSPESGLATQKYVVLSHELPPMGAGPEPWRKIGQVPDADREPYRAEWLPFLDSTDSDYVGQVYERVVLPPEEGSEVSAEPARNYLEPGAFYTLYYHLGLRETEALLRDVFWEGLRNHGDLYASHVRSELLGSAAFARNYIPYLPVPDLNEPTESFFDLATNGFFGERRRIVRMVDESLFPRDALAADIWRPGARAFSFLAFLRYVPPVLLWGLMLGGLVPLCVGCARRRSLAPVEAVFLLSFAALLGVISFSALLFVFRMKELILAQPLIYLVSGTAVSMWASWLAGGSR